MSGIKVVLLEDACASQAIGGLSPEQTHRAAIDRMGYAFAQIVTTAALCRQRYGGPRAPPYQRRLNVNDCRESSLK
jgi:hypothetical protein